MLNWYKNLTYIFHILICGVCLTWHQLHKYWIPGPLNKFSYIIFSSGNQRCFFQHALTFSERQDRTPPPQSQSRKLGNALSTTTWNITIQSSKRFPREVRCTQPTPWIVQGFFSVRQNFWSMLYDLTLIEELDKYFAVIHRIVRKWASTWKLNKYASLMNLERNITNINSNRDTGFSHLCAWQWIYN